MALKYKNQNFSAYAKIGIRLDSSRDFSAGLTGLSYKESNGFQNIINYPVPLNDQSQTTRLERITGNFSFLHRKTKLITKYAALSISTEERDLSIRSSFTAKQNYDSLREHSVTSPISIIFDYNANNKTKKNATREMGVQGYLRQTQQDYEAYNLKSTDNTDNQLLYARPDSFNLSQFSVSPYFKITRGFSQKSNLVIRSRTEVYHIKVNGKDLSTFLLPSLNLQQNFLKNNNSLSISTGINFFKPGLDILLPLQYNVNPAIKNLGNSSLNPSKNLYFGLQFDSYRKINMIHKLIFAYSYDVTRNYTTFDSVSQLLIKMPDDHNKVQSIAYSLDFEAVVFKKVNLFVTGTLTYAQYRNSIFKTHHSGWALSSSALLSYPLGEKLGTLGLSTYITGKEFNAQGSSVGSTNYSAYYAKTFFRNKIAVTFLANEFLAKYRDYSSTTFGDNSRQFVNYRRPYRLLSLRVAYRFSNIKVNKKAVEKRASIKDESSNR
ncbi:MAG: hypothetical protein EOO07_18695 [Chitinophagaceae bacterium]|nr:MAG: hypothetical protein EOO07_18695 [Chitinophagaceae bacterium]